MKEDKVRNFMISHRQNIGEDSFTSKLFYRLTIYPTPKKAKKTSFIVLIAPALFLLAAVAVGLLGGWDILVSHLKSDPLDYLNILWLASISLALSLLACLTILIVNWRETY